MYCRLVISPVTELVPKPLPNHGFSRTTARVSCQGPRREPQKPWSCLPLYKYTEATESPSPVTGASVSSGFSRTTQAASTNKAAAPFINKRYCRDARQTREEETIAAAMEAREKLLNRSTHASTSSIFKRRRRGPLSADKNPHRSIGVSATAIIAPSEFEFP